jgi:uncharacterized repeat protein (TIGR01451 family)
MGKKKKRKKRRQKNQNPNQSSFHQHKLKSPENKENYLDELETILTKEVEIPEDKILSPEKQTKETKEDSTVLAQIIAKKKKQRRNRLLIGSIIGLSLLVIASVAGFIFFSNNGAADEHVQLNIKGPEKVTVGQEVTYTISYSNIGDIDIKNAKLIVQEPHGFQITKTEPEVNGRSWDLADLFVGQRGKIELTGRIIDNPEVEQKLTAMLIFVPLNFNSEFTIERSFNIALMPPELGIEANLPQTITLGEKFALEITLKNENLDPIENLKLAVAYPPDFNVTYTDKAGLQGDNEWLISDFEPAAEQKMKIEGYFPEEMSIETSEDRLQDFQIEIQYPNQDQQFFTQQEKTVTTKIVDQAFVAYMIINGSSENKNVNLEDILHFSVVYQNKGDKTFNDLRVQAVINSQPDQVLDWDEINDEEFGQIEKTDQGRAITWSSLQIPELEKISPDEEGTIDFSIPIKSFDEIEDADVNQLGNNVIEAYTVLQLTDDAGTALPTIESSKITLGLNSNVTLNNQALYYFEDGTPIGSGPLPPKAGAKTSYVVFWELQNDLHELENIKIKTTLGDKVNWLDKTLISAGEIDYDEDTKELIWSLNRLPLSAEQASLTFHIELEPSRQDIGKLMILLNNTILTAQDSVTGDIITITDNVLTTNLDEDEFGMGKGVVASEKADDDSY